MSKKVNKDRIIYLGGMPRSGSTWLGNVISQSSKVRYYHEPFHPGRGHLANPFNDFFQFLPKEGMKDNLKEERLVEYLIKLQKFRVPRLYDVGDIRNWKKVSYFYHPFSRWLSIVKRQIPLIKDPPSILLIEWMSTMFQLSVIFTVRHPAAFVNSSRKAGWHYGLQTFLNQSELMERYLSSFEDEIRADVEAGHTSYSLENATLFWRLIQHMLNSYHIDYPEWLFVKHEDLLRNSNNEIEKIFDFLKISFDIKVERYLQKTLELNGKKSERLRRDPNELLFEWKRGLSSFEIEKVKELSKDEWKLFYKESDW